MGEGRNDETLVIIRIWILSQECLKEFYDCGKMRQRWKLLIVGGQLSENTQARGPQTERIKGCLGASIIIIIIYYAMSRSNIKTAFTVTARTHWYCNGVLSSRQCSCIVLSSHRRLRRHSCIHTSVHIARNTTTLFPLTRWTRNAAIPLSGTDNLKRVPVPRNFDVEFGQFWGQSSLSE